MYVNVSCNWNHFGPITTLNIVKVRTYVMNKYIFNFYIELVVSIKKIKNSYCLKIKKLTEIVGFYINPYMSLLVAGNLCWSNLLNFFQLQLNPDAPLDPRV